MLVKSRTALRGSRTRSIGRVEFGNCKRSIRTALKTLRKGVLFAIQERSCYQKNIDFTKPHETYNLHMRIENSWKIGCKVENDVGLKIYGFILTSIWKLACRLLHCRVVRFIGIVKYAGKYFKRYDLTLCFFKLFFLDSFNLQSFKENWNCANLNRFLHITIKQSFYYSLLDI